MKPHRVWLVAMAVLLATLPGIGQACSLADVSLYEQFGTHSKVFLGTSTPSSSMKSLKACRTRTSGRWRSR